MGIGHAIAHRQKEKQLLLIKHSHWKFRYTHGGILRNFRKGRKARPLSTKEPIHLVLKINRIKRGLRSPLAQHIVSSCIKKYSRKFFIKVEQVAINHDHVHLIIRIPRRAMSHNFLRVVAGQIAQQFYKNKMYPILTDELKLKLRKNHTTQSAENTGNTSSDKSVSASVTDTPAAPQTEQKLWKFRPFTRVVKGYRPYQQLKDYVRLNLKEAQGKIVYKKDRLKGLSPKEYEELWE